MYDDTGAGEPIVLVHGLATTHAIWRRAAPVLAAHRRVIAIDVPGFGGSPPAGPGFALDAVAARIAAGLAQAGVEPPYDLVGHSMGGALALTLARRAPRDVRSLVLVAPAGLRSLPRGAAEVVGAAGSGLIALRRAAAPLAATGWGRRTLLVGGSVDGARFAPSEVRAMVGASHGATRVRQALAAVARTDLRPAAVSVPVPLGLLRGERDPLVSDGDVAKLARRRDGLVVGVVPGCGHLPMMEQPDAFVAELEHMLERLHA